MRNIILLKYYHKADLVIKCYFSELIHSVAFFCLVDFVFDFVVWFSSIMKHDFLEFLQLISGLIGKKKNQTSTKNCFEV